jgi:iron complex outermembrane receptor protein
VNVGANNLFNQKPPSVPNVSCGVGCVRPGDGNNVYGEPDQFSPFGIDGGYYYGRVTVEW